MLFEEADGPGNYRRVVAKQQPAKGGSYCALNKAFVHVGRDLGFRLEFIAPLYLGEGRDGISVLTKFITIDLVH